MKRRHWIAGLIVLVSSAGLMTWTARDRISQPAAEIVEIERAPFVRAIEASGEIRSADSVIIGCPSIPRMWNFTIARLTPEGREVRTGMPLVSFDSKKLQEELQVKRAELETARKTLEKTRLEEREKLEALVLEMAEIEAKQARTKRKLEVPVEFQERLELEKLKLDAELVKEELRLSALRIETQQQNMTARIETTKNKVKRLERKVDQYTENIGKMNVTAPRDGFAVYVTDWNGEKPKVGESIWKGRAVMEIADLSKMEVAAEVAEPDAGYVRVGQEVELRLDASPERMFKGRIKELGRLFRTKSNEIPSMVFDAIVAIDAPDPELMKPGMAASVQIMSATEEPAIQIREDAVRRTAEGPAVEVQSDGGGFELVHVELGERWQGQVIIESGLEEGDRVRMGNRGS